MKIEELLNNVLHKIYGKEVRQSFVDAIRQCYKDATGHPESVAGVIEENKNMQKQLDSNINTINGRIDTILTGTVNTTKLVTVHSATIRNNSASDLTFKISSKDNETLKSIKDKSPTVINANVIAKALDGVAINGASIPSSYNVESTNDEYVITVYSGSSSVVGQYVFMAVVTIAYKDTATDISSAELKDIRTGANGTTYPTAGDAVREQINNLKKELDDSNLDENVLQIQKNMNDIGSLKEDLGGITQIDKSSNVLDISDYTEGRYYSTSSGGYHYNNDYFTVDNYVEVESSRSYVLSEFIDGVFSKLLSSIIIFYDKNKKYLSGGQYSTFITPEDAKYIRLSFNKDLIGKQLLVEKGTEPSKIWTPYYKTLYLKGEKIINFLYENIKNKPTINGVEISGNKTSKDYGIPDVHEITETYNLYKTNEITVDINGNGDFRKLQDAINSITDNSQNNRYVIYIKEGEYDLAEGISDDENDSSVVGLMIPNWVTLKGLGNRENVILKAKFINKKLYVSTLNFKETGAIENLTVIGENTRYVIHDDFARNSSGYKRNVKHCRIKGVTTYYSTIYGAGTGDGADWEFEDVIFDGSQVGANSKPANTFTVHNVLASQKNRNIVFKNCIFVSTSERNVKFKTIAYRTSTGADNANNMLTNVSLYGCKFDGTDKGFELIEENPDVYGKGCYYFVNGYGNINAGYEITTTDNKDYSDRVNLI